MIVHAAPAALNPSLRPNGKLIEDKNRENRIGDGTDVIRHQMEVHDYFKTSENIRSNIRRNKKRVEVYLLF